MLLQRDEELCSTTSNSCWFIVWMASASNGCCKTWKNLMVSISLALSQAPTHTVRQAGAHTSRLTHTYPLQTASACTNEHVTDSQRINAAAHNHITNANTRGIARMQRWIAAHGRVWAQTRQLMLTQSMEHSKQGCALFTRAPRH